MLPVESWEVINRKIDTSKFELQFHSVISYQVGPPLQVHYHSLLQLEPTLNHINLNPTLSTIWFEVSFSKAQSVLPCLVDVPHASCINCTLNVASHHATYYGVKIITLWNNHPPPLLCPPFHFSYCYVELIITDQPLRLDVLMSFCKYFHSSKRNQSQRFLFTLVISCSKCTTQSCMKTTLKWQWLFLVGWFGCVVPVLT